MRVASCLICFIIIAAFFCGCQETSKPFLGPMEQKPKIYEDIIWVSFSIEMPYLDADNDHYPDGILVDVTLNRPNEKAFVAGRGSMIFYLIQRTKDSKGLITNKELYKWEVPEDKVLRSITRQRFGLICHHIALYWHGIPQPKGNGLYVQAEFIRTDKQRIVSRMVPLSIPEKQ
jgi:hypothetical protein